MSTGNKRFEDFIEWFEGQGADLSGVDEIGPAGGGRIYFYRFRSRMLIVNRYPAHHGFDVYAPVTDENSVEAVKQALLAIPDPAEERKLAQRVIDLVERLGIEGFTDEHLDPVVHDVQSGKASDVNNGGLAAQVEFLLRSGQSEEDIVAEAEAERYA